MIITANTLVRNEARFLWYSVMSVIHHVDRVRIWDMDSDDGTQEIIKELLKTEVGKQKIFYVKIPKDTNFAEARQKMLDIITADWFLVVDGDEIWWDSSIKKVIEFIKNRGKSHESIVVPTINLVGDMYHYQEKEAGMYRFGNRIGHYNLRGINRNIPGLKSYGEHGMWGYVDDTNMMIQYRDSKRIKFINAPYLHATFLRRSKTRYLDSQVLKRKKKLKYEIGNIFPADFYYPEVFFRPRPKIVDNIWEKMTYQYRLRSMVETPLRKIRRRYLPKRVGY